MKKYVYKALELFREEVISLFDRVLYDWGKNPNSSAVMTNNQIITYLRAMEEVGTPTPFANPMQMLLDLEYPQEDYAVYTERLKVESGFYEGVQLCLADSGTVKVFKNHFPSQAERMNLMKASGVEYGENARGISFEQVLNPINKGIPLGEYAYTKLALDYFTSGLLAYFDKVLANSHMDPHMSAVWTNSSAVIYLCAMSEVGESLNMTSTLKLFQHLGKTREECEAFERWRRQESVYYGAPQYILTKKGKVKRFCNTFESPQEWLELIKKAGIDISHWIPG